jgi:hypothetical protein
MAATADHAAVLWIVAPSPHLVVICRCDLRRPTFARSPTPSSHFVRGIAQDSSNRKNLQDPSNSAGASDGAVQVLTEEITGSRVGAGPQSRTDAVMEHETQPAGAGHPSEGSRSGIKSRDELRQQQNSRAMAGELLLRLSIGSRRILRIRMDEVEDRVSPPPPCLVPHQVS